MGLTITDIAKAAGVSTATVSRAINRNYPVSREARARIDAAVARLHYRPNVFARGLMKARTDSVGIIVPYLSNPYHTEILDAIETALSRAGIFIYICCSYDNPELEKEYVRRLEERNVDAIIMVEGTTMGSRRNSRGKFKISRPLVLVNDHLAVHGPHHLVRCAQEPGLQEAFHLLHTLAGHNIALVRGGTCYSFDLKERLFRRFLSQKGITPRANCVYRITQAGDLRAVDEAAALASSFLKQRKPPRAIIAANDLIALGILRGAAAMGVRVPADLAVIGVDNTVFAGLASPRLSTVDLCMGEVGNAAAKTYLSLRDKGFRSPRPILVTIDSKLVIRETS